jgi:hypothetical protein
MKSTEYNDIERPEHTLDKISELKTDEVLVLGLSIEGMHGCWAAYTAFKKIRAALRCGVGLRCQSYAIPTMYGGIEDIRPYVDEFVRYAAENREQFFYVTRIGCDIAVFKDREISPLFVEARGRANCVSQSRGGGSRNA